MEVDTDTHKDSSPSEGAELMPGQSYLFVVLECDRPIAGGARVSLRAIDEVIMAAARRGARRVQ